MRDLVRGFAEGWATTRPSERFIVASALFGSASAAHGLILLQLWR